MKLRTAQYQQDVDSLTFSWFQKARSHNLPISGPLIKEKALEFSKATKNTDFKASNGWLDRFKKRHNITSVVISGESASSVDESVVADWKAKLPQVVADFEPKNIFNMDETGIFYCAVPDKTLKVKGDECKGGKKSKERITASFCVNMEGEFEKTFVIGKCAKPRCFQNLSVKTLPVIWEHNKKTWMTADIFRRWLNDFNAKMKRKKRRVLLLLDNAPSHPKDIVLSNVKTVFLPANTISVRQPLDQGIIKAVKTQYRKQLLQKVLAKMNKGDKTSNILKCVSVLDAINWISRAVKYLDATTVKKCFYKSGVALESNIESFDTSDEISLAELVLQVQEHLGIDGEGADEYVTGDDNVPTCDLSSTNLTEQVLDEFQERLREPVCEYDFDEDEIEPITTLSTSNSPIENVGGALKLIEELRKFLSQQKDAAHLITPLYDGESGLFEMLAKRLKQTSILDVFSK